METVRTIPGDPVASWDWEEIRRRCLALAIKLLRSRDDAEDAVQEALVRGLRHASSCEGREDPIPWLMTITRRECTRLAGRRGARGEAPMEACGECGDGSDTSRTVARDLDLKRAVARLSDEERLLVGLRHGRQLTYAEVASAVGVPEATAKTKLRRIRARMRTKMEVA